MARQLTQGEQEYLIDYMRNMKADEAFVSQRVKNVQEEGSSPRFGYLDVGDNILIEPAIYRMVPVIGENFEQLPQDFQQQVIRGGRARDEARFMGASGGSLVTPDQRRFGLLYGDMPYMDTTARRQLPLDQELESMSSIVDERGNPVVTTMPAPNMPEESNKGVFAGLLNAVNGVADRVAQKRGFTQNAVNPLQTNTQAGGTYQESKPVDAGFLARQNYPSDTQIKATPPSVTDYETYGPNAKDITGSEFYGDTVAQTIPVNGGAVDNRLSGTVYGGDKFATGQETYEDPSRAAVDNRITGAAGRDLGVDQVISGVQRADTAVTPISFDVDSGLGFKPDGQRGLQGDPNDIEYQAGEIQKDLEEAIPEAKEKLDFGRLAKALALGFNTLRLNPDQQLASYLGKSLEQDRQLKIARAAADRYRKAGYSQIADALMAGEITGKEAFSAYSALAKAPVFRPATVEEKARYGLKAGDFAQIDNKSGRLYTSSGATFNLGDKAGTAIDSEFAKTYMQDLRGLGGSMQQIKTLRRVLESLESGEVKTGVKEGLLPDWALAIVDPKSLDARNQVAGIVQQTLRETLGAQFTEREGENLLRRAWDLRQSTEINIRNTRKLLDKAMSYAEEKMKQVQYFQNNGTLKGYKSENLASLMAELEEIKRDLTRNFSDTEQRKIKKVEDSFNFGGDEITIKKKD